MMGLGREGVIAALSDVYSQKAAASSMVHSAPYIFDRDMIMELGYHWSSHSTQDISVAGV